MGFSRQDYWSGLPLPSAGNISRLRDWTQVSCIAGDLLHFRWVLYWLNWEALLFVYSPTWFIFPQNIWGGLQEYFHCNKNIYELKFGTWRGKYCRSPQGSISLARWLTAQGSPDIQYHLILFFKSQVYIPSQTSLSQLLKLMDILDSHELLICSPNLLRPHLFLSLQPLQPTNGHFSSPPWYTVGWALSYSAWISERNS